MKLKITKKEKFKQKNGNGEASIIYAITNNGNEIMIYDYSSQDSFDGTMHNRKYLYAVEPWNYYKTWKWNYYNNNGWNGGLVTFPYDIESFEKISTEDIFEETDINISGYQFEDPRIGWYPSENVQREYIEKYGEVYQEIGEAYDLDTIGEFESYCPPKYKTMLERGDFTDEQKYLIKKIAKMRAYCDSEEIRTMLDEKIEEIITGKAIIAAGRTYKQGYSDVLNSMGAFDAEYLKSRRLDEFFGDWRPFGRIHPGDSAWPFSTYDVVRIVSMGEKQVELPDGRKYIGTFDAKGKHWDVCVCPDGRIDIDNAPFLTVDRFDIESGSEEPYEEYNEEIRQEKQRRRDFYIGVMQDIEKTFGLSSEQAKILLKYAGTVTALKDVTELGKAGVSNQELRAILRKISYDGVHSISGKVSDVFKGRLDIFQDAAETLLYLDYLLGGEEERKKVVEHSLQEISDIDVREGEVKAVLGETARAIESSRDTKVQDEHDSN